MMAALQEQGVAHAPVAGSAGSYKGSRCRKTERSSRKRLRRKRMPRRSRGAGRRSPAPSAWRQGGVGACVVAR